MSPTYFAVHMARLDEELQAARLAGVLQVPLQTKIRVRGNHRAQLHRARQHDHHAIRLLAFVEERGPPRVAPGNAVRAQRAGCLRLECR